MRAGGAVLAVPSRRIRAPASPAISNTGSLRELTRTEAVQRPKPNHLQPAQNEPERMSNSLPRNDRSASSQFTIAIKAIPDATTVISWGRFMGRFVVIGRCMKFSGESSTRNERISSHRRRPCRFRPPSARATRTSNKPYASRVSTERSGLESAGNHHDASTIPHPPRHSPLS